MTITSLLPENILKVMSEYWVSTAKRYCDACKCYIGDNKASIQNHEQGKRHKENVAKRVDAIAKRGAEDYAKQTAYEEEIAKIEAAALAAVAKDGITLGEQDRKQYREMVACREEAPHKSYYEAAAAKLKRGGDRRAGSTTQGPLASAKLKTPDETKGAAGAWVTVAVRDIPPKKEEDDTGSDVKTSVAIDEIPLPPPDKRKRFGEKVVSLSGLYNDDNDRSGTTGDGVSKVEFGFKRKVNRGNMRQRTTDD